MLDMYHFKGRAELGMHNYRGGGTELGMYHSQGEGSTKLVATPIVYQGVLHVL